MKAIMNKLISSFLIFAVLTPQAGCSMFAFPKQKLNVTTSERDAKIYVNGEFIGYGSAETKVKRNQKVAILATKDGYSPATRKISPQFSRLGIIDMIGGYIIIVPFIGLIFPGAKELSKDNVSLVLEKLN